MKFENKTVLVTGANRGIGLAVVKQLLKNGAKKIYAAARDPESIPDLGDARVVPLQIDITSGDHIGAAARVANDIDVLINNAGIAAYTSLLDGPSDLLHRDMDTNYYGTLDMVRAFVPVLENKQDAAIVNVVTIAAFANFPIVGGYSASKAALFSLSQGIRIELASRGIAVHTVNPGPIDTRMAEEFPTEKADVDETAARILAGIEEGEADIFPDDMGKQMFDVWRNDYRDLEKMVLEMYQAA